MSDWWSAFCGMPWWFQWLIGWFLCGAIAMVIELRYSLLDQARPEQSGVDNSCWEVRDQLPIYPIVCLIGPFGLTLVWWANRPLDDD